VDAILKSVFGLMEESTRDGASSGAVTPCRAAKRRALTKIEAFAVQDAHDAPRTEPKGPPARSGRRIRLTASTPPTSSSKPATPCSEAAHDDADFDAAIGLAEMLLEASGERNGRKRGKRQRPAKSVEQPTGDTTVDACAGDASSSEASSDAKSDLDAEEAAVWDKDIELTDDILQDLMMDDVPDFEDSSYKGDWSNAPRVGSNGFAEFVGKLMRSCLGDSCVTTPTLEAKATCPPLLPHQESVGFLLHPKSPVTRCLVDHPTGSGKTREIIKVLDNYFFDPRPKVPIFPKEPVCQNFYAELLRWPSRYRDFFCLMKPLEASMASGVADWKTKRSDLWALVGLPEQAVRQMCRSMLETLEMKGYFYMGRMRRSLRNQFFKRFPDETCLPGGPLRALRYTTAGGWHASIDEGSSLPVNSMMKIGFDRSSKDQNVYSNKVIIMDEVHNLVRTKTMYAEQLGRLRELLSSCVGSVVAGFTGTPILGDASEGRRLLDIIKGNEAVAAGAGDEGFTSSFHVRPLQLFPASLPKGVPDSLLTPKLRRQFVQKVTMLGESLQRYDVKRANGLEGQRIRNYCNVSVYFGALHDGRLGSRTRIMGDFANCAPKLNKMVEDVVADSSKTLVLVAKHSGMTAVLARLQEVASASQPPFGVATIDELAEFNALDNLRGERYRVMVADATTCSEGVSFLAVRRLLLGDVPSTPTALMQTVGRCVRMYGHSGLPAEEQTMTTSLYAAAFPSWLRSAIGCWAYRAMPSYMSQKDAERKAKRLLRSLRQVGIHDLEKLKKVLDDFAEKSKQKAKVGENPGTTIDFCDFLTSIGLPAEATRIREWMMAQMKSDLRHPKRPRRSDGKQVAESSTPPQVAVESGAPKLHHLVRALAELCRTSASKDGEPSDVVKQLRLSPFTADEEALSLLSEKSREVTPALAELRSKALDRDFLADWEQKEEADDASMSGGETSAPEFDIGEPSGDEEGQTPQELPVVLPEGWRLRASGVKGRGREFVDPAGNVYRNVHDVKKAIEAARRATNMASRHEIFAARLRARLNAKQNAEAPSSDQNASVAIA